MLKIQIKPISKWIGTETKHPNYGRFRQTYADTKKILEYELGKAGAIAESVQLEMFIHPSDLRNDGELRANARPYKPGVILSFSKVKRRFFDERSQSWKNEMQTISYPCDKYESWKDNLRAIALSLQKLRDVARYGVFKYEDMLSRLALPSAEGKISSRESAAEFLSKHSGTSIGQILNNYLIAKTAYRTALGKLHPDKGGSNDDFHKLQEAKKILEI